MSNNAITLSFAQLHDRFSGVLNDDCHFMSVSTDTRSLNKGDVFVALKGPSFDGHSYIQKAIDLGAAGIISEQPLEPRHKQRIPVWLVADSYKALAQCAILKREQYTGKVVAITGSAGKTTVKGMVNAILLQVGNTLATQGNFNNHVGVPLTMMQISNDHRFIVVEAGASLKGDISYLVNIIQPHVALVNNVYGAHLEGLESLQGVAIEKSAIYSRFAPSATAILNLDTDYVNDFKHVIADVPTRSYSLSKSEHSDVYVSGSRLNDIGVATFTLCCKTGQECDVTLGVIGQHNIANALAAASICLALEVSLDNIAQGLLAYKGDAGRMQAKTLIENTVLVDDTYNANIGSVNSAIHYLANLKNTRTLLLLGDVAELGVDAKKVHAHLGEYAKKQGVNALWCVGDLTHNTATAFNNTASATHQISSTARWFDSQHALINAFLQEDFSNTVILAKGSRSAKMDLIVVALHEHFLKVNSPC